VLVGFQTFRLPLELVMHCWAVQGTIPTTMTWTGQNWDVVGGIAALLLAPLARRRPVAAWLAIVVGSLLLLNVVRVAVLSSPLPFAWEVQPRLQLAMHFPYMLIGPVCVAGALFGHIVLTRAMLRVARSPHRQRGDRSVHTDRRRSNVW
jgi:threonine/homoserine efflux transporter RhtA